MSFVTEIYVSIDGLEFTKLDLYKDESIPMKYTSKDLQDVSKIFSPYSQSFTFPATPKNRAAFGFFGDTDVIKINPDNKFSTKIYTDGVLNLQGYLQLTDVKYKSNKPTDFTGGFATSMTNLKDRIGEDLISDLASVSVDWTPNEVFNRLKSAKNLTIEGVNVLYFVPLVSNTRVLRYDPNTELDVLDNIAYDVIISPKSNNVIQPTELRPCINFSSIIEFIKLRYNLQVIAPLDSRNEYKDAFIWCNKDTGFSVEEKLMTIKNSFGTLKWRDTKNFFDISAALKYTPITSNLTDNSFKVVRIASYSNDYNKFFNVVIKLENITVTSNSDSTPKVTFRLVRKSDLSTINTETFDLNASTVSCSMKVDDVFFQSNQIEFFIYAQFNQPTIWNNCLYEINYRYYDGKYGPFNSKRYATYYQEITQNNNSNDVGGANIDLFASLPEIKVIDFLTSYFKTFNISVFDTSPDDDNLFWLTPSDINTTNKTYSKATLDYTPYVDVKEYSKSVPSDYNYYNFKHATSKYKSNVDFAIGTGGIEFGQTVYPAVKPDNPTEFKVETIFSIVPTVDLSGTDIPTFYGFEADTAELLDTGETRYTPNFGELTIFYNHGNVSLGREFGFKNLINNVAVNSKLTSYMKVLPWNKDGYSLGFSILVYKGISYLNSLYKVYYEAQTLRLLDPNVMVQEFTAKLPTNEMYLNEATTTQNGGKTPTGFRLQNDIIVGENLFSIIDADIDITTGKAKLKLLNY